MKRPAAFLSAALLALCGSGSARESTPPHDPLTAGFRDPPPEARPLVYWQWVNGNVSLDGIRLDLEWMQRIGLAGALIFDIGFRTPPVPQFVPVRVAFGTPAWSKAVAHARAEAQRLGLLLGAQSGGGWSVSGGPSVPPEQAMKKLVWSETVLTPDSPHVSPLPAPPSASGPYQDAPIPNPEFREPTRSGPVAVIAYRLPAAEQPAWSAPVLRVPSAEHADLRLLQDGSYATSVEVAPDASGNVTVLAEAEFIPRVVTIGIALRGEPPGGVIESSADGIRYSRVESFEGGLLRASGVMTFNLAANPHRYWRARLQSTALLALSEVRFEPGEYLRTPQLRAGYGIPEPLSLERNVPAEFVVDPDGILDLTSRLSADGKLSWRPDSGRWVVLRFGWSLTGRRTVPATPESIGLEVDKLDAAAVRAFAETFYRQYGKLDMALTDSWEAGHLNWTPTMFDEFRRLRGYDLRPWMPVLTGRIVASHARTDRVLNDFRRTIADLVARHYEAIADVAHQRGMTYYSQAAGTGMPVIVDALQAKGRVDVPTGEFWVWPEGQPPLADNLVDIREAASAAHVYGRRLVAAEALTSRGEEPWAQGPAQWRRMVDRFFAEGVNKIILHTSAHQPFTDRAPGITLRQYGQHFTRNETWAEDARAWVQYLARTSYLLQQGEPVADLLVHVGGNAPHTVAPGPDGNLARAPGYDYDLINDEALLERLEFRDGKLAMPNGKNYRVLDVGAHFRHASPAVRNKLASLARAGAVICGGWEHDASTAAADRVKVHASVNDAFASLELLPDVFVEGRHSLHWTHRRKDVTDIYFVTNQSPREFSGKVDFRVQGRTPELWDAVTATRRSAEFAASGAVTGVKLTLAPWSSTFVVFRQSSQGSGQWLPATTTAILRTLEGPWTVRFHDGRGAPDELSMPQLRSWTESALPDVRYYSGRATYSQVFELPPEWRSAGTTVQLDLGTVGEMASVRLNGVDLGTWWWPPYRGDITNALRAGHNQVEIRVTNYWANRLIGDEQPGAVKFTFSSLRPYQASSPLRPSGLLGPVRLLTTTNAPESQTR